MFKIDEETQKALNLEAEEINSQAATPVAEQQATEEVQQEEAEVATEEQSTGTETVEEEPKKGYQARVQELNQRAKKAEERAKSLEDKLAELTTPTPGINQQGYGQTQFDPNEPLVAPGEEIDGTELSKRLAIREQKILQQADSRAQLIAKQSEAVNRINSEASEVVRTYPELDPDNDNFDKELSDTITEATEAFVKSNPYSASVKKFVAGLMRPYKRAADKEAAQATASIAKQASQAALRPTSARKAEKTIDEKSIEELEAELGIVQV